MLYLARRVWPEVGSRLPSLRLESRSRIVLLKKSCPATNLTFKAFITLLLAIVPGQGMQAQKFKVLHTFTGANGADPEDALVTDTAGNLYGTTSIGGQGICGGLQDCGTAFKLNKTGKQAWLHSFNGTNGEEPYAGLLRDATGN